MGADTTTGPTPPALTAAQMALVQTLADVLHNQKTGEACQALLSDWFELRAENTELRARIEALEGERDALDKQVVSCGHELANMASGWMRETAAKEQAETALTTAQARIEAVERERDNWQETAAQHCRNEEFWRGLVHQTGAHFGPAAYTADDGSVGDRVLGLKVPELAQAVVAERDALEARVGFLEGEAERAWQSFSNETTRAEQAEAVREEAQELLGEARSRIEALERERDAAVASRMSDHGILLDAWRDRGEAVPGVDRESTVLRVIRGIHAMRDRAEQAEAELTAARTRAEGLEAALSEVLSGFPYAEILTGLEPDSGEKHLRSYDARATQGQIEKWRAVLATPPPATTGEEPTR